MDVILQSWAGLSIPQPAEASIAAASQEAERDLLEDETSWHCCPHSSALAASADDP